MHPHTYAPNRGALCQPLSEPERQVLERKHAHDRRLRAEAIATMRELHELSARGLAEPKTFIERVRELDPRDLSYFNTRFSLPNFDDEFPLTPL